MRDPVEPKAWQGPPLRMDRLGALAVASAGLLLALGAADSRGAQREPSTAESRLSPVPAIWAYVPGDVLGRQVVSGAAGGDVNGDGYDDVVLGEPGFGGGRGRLLVFLGAPGGLPGVPSATVEGLESDQGFGSHVGFLGDVDHDGRDDVMVGLAASEPRRPQVILQGSERGLDRSRAWGAPGLAHAAGDVNADGFADVVMQSSGPKGQGCVSVHAGSRDGPAGEPMWQICDETNQNNLGRCLARAGDVNGDGIDDLLVGSMEFSGRMRKCGRAQLFLGSRQGLGAEAWSAEYPLPVRPGVDEAYEQFFSWGLSSAGDVNGDGCADFLVGACFADHGDLNEGVVFLYLGSRGALSRSPAWWFESNQAHALLGQGVAAAGDLNGDGWGDFIVGVSQFTDGERDEGAVLAFHGAPQGPSATQDWFREGNHTNGEYGMDVAGAGDVNADGYSDILVYSPGYRVTSSGHVWDAGRFEVIYGSRRGLPGSHRYQFSKPWLTSFQQELDRSPLREGGARVWLATAVLFAGVVAVLAVALSRLRRRLKVVLEENRNLTLESERRRIARDLHDELGSHLHRLAGAMDELDPSLRTVARDVTVSLERTIWALHPDRRSISDLACGLTDLAEAILQGTSIAPRFEIPIELPRLELSPSVLNAVFRSAQEALNNVRKHSGARQVILSLECNPSLISVVIADDGRGFEGAMRQPAAGHGMANMMARMAEVGGSCVVEPGEPRGVRVRLNVPVAAS